MVEHSLVKIDPLTELIRVVIFPLLSGNTHKQDLCQFWNKMEGILDNPMDGLSMDQFNQLYITQFGLFVLQDTA